MTDASIPVVGPVLGLLLAGGLARRMGGGDKALKTIGGMTILDHVLERLKPQCAAVVLNANGDPSRFAAWGLPVVPDSVEGFAGPLAGILAGLDWAATHNPSVTHVVSVAADTPFIPRDLVVRMVSEMQEAKATLASAASGGWNHPVIALWPVMIRDVLRDALLVGNERKIDRFTSRYPLATVTWTTDPIDPFFNANEPDDLAKAEGLWRAGQVT